MHDASYKLLFSHAERVEDLLRGFVPQSWVQALDFSTLEKVNASSVADDPRNRHDDVVWRVRFRDHWLYVYLLLEFQSTVDRFMAVRILSDTGLLYQDLIRGQSLHQDRLPPVLPIVLYNGDTRWTAAVELSELLEPIPVELQAFQPQQRYFLLDEYAYREQRLASLRRAFSVWIQQMFPPDNDPIASGPMIELEELPAMLAQRIQQWKQEWRAEGLAEGLKNMRSVLLRQVHPRFDAETADALAPLLEPVNDPEELTQIGEWIILCASGEALLSRARTRLGGSH